MSQGGGPGAALGHEAVVGPADVQVGQFAELRYQSAHHRQRLGRGGIEAKKSLDCRSFILQTRALIFTHQQENFSAGS